MPWTYDQHTGELSHDGVKVCVGYSGCGVGKNDSLSESVHDVGPIPRGVWTIGPRFESESHGPICMRLTPTAETKTYGRSGFLIHGDSRRTPGSASKGCVILPGPVRCKIAASTDRVLRVV